MASSPSLSSQDQQPLQAALSIPRGGAWYFGKKTAARKYRELLEEQVFMLDKQLRQSQNELALLRRQLKTSQSLLHRSAHPGARIMGHQADKLRALTENQDLKKRVGSLTQEVLQLEKIRDELQTMMEVQHAKMQELEAKLNSKELENQQMAAHFERELQRLVKEMDAKYRKQIADLTKLMEARVTEAALHARHVAMADLESKVAEATDAERRRGERLLEEERKRSEASVEREKVKMRKLAKALFEREKKLNTLDKDISSAMDVSNNVKSSMMASSKTNNNSFKVDTIRKF